MKKTRQTKLVFEAHGGIANTGQLLEEGVTYYLLKELLTTGQVSKLKHGIYRWTDFLVTYTLAP